MTGNLGERIERKSRQFRSAWHRSLAGSRKTFRSLDQRRLHLLPFFTKRRARDVTTDLIRRYIRNRIEQSASPASIHREVAALKRVFSLGMESTSPKVRIVPYIPMFEERNVRSGFLKDEDCSALATECSKEGCGYAWCWAVAYNFGWRAGEVIGLRVGQIDVGDRTIRLEVGSTNNGRGRTVKMTTEVFTLLNACIIGNS